MILPIVKFGHPILRQKGARIPSITPDIEALIRDMFETMYDAAGIGLAAQQVGQKLQLAVVDVRGITDRPSTLQIDGNDADVQGFMPLVVINPELRPFGDRVPGPEGCLSFPEIYAEVIRELSVEVRAMGGKGEPLHFTAGGLLARVIQHEVDHLNGLLFIDRMATKTKQGLKEELESLQAETKASLQAHPT